MSDTLVLDQNWKPVGFVPWQRAVKLYFEDRANIVKEDLGGKVLHSPSFEMGMPRVIQVKNAWTKRMRMSVPCTRRNLLTRDHATCQYCGKVVGTHEYTIDHVVPRCQGGKTEWTNVVIACVRCNKNKGGLTPEQAGMPLRTHMTEAELKFGYKNRLYTPKVTDPRFNFKLRISKLRPEWQEWSTWLYWNVELDK